MELSAQGLTFAFRRGFALGPLEICLRKGEVIALLGPNGAGKTTLLRLLAGLLQPRDGGIFLNGSAARAAQLRRWVAYAPTEPAFPPQATVSELLRLRARTLQVPWEEAEQRLAAILQRPLHIFPTRLSRGQRLQVALTAALLGDPPVILVDEPWAGLDPLARQKVIESLAQLGREAAVLISSHDLHLLPAVAQRFVFIHRGKIQAQGSAAQLATRVGREGQAIAEVLLAVWQEMVEKP
jgi:ABC-2 type transport system ATP-binding protein